MTYSSLVQTEAEAASMISHEISLAQLCVTIVTSVTTQDEPSSADALSANTPTSRITLDGGRRVRQLLHLTATAGPRAKARPFP